MSRVFPYPLMMASLVVMWMLLAGFTPGQLLIGLAVALFAGQGLAALEPAKPYLKRWDLIIQLFLVVLYDIIRSNIAVASIILQRDRRGRNSGFMTIPLELRHPMGLAILAIIITSTPGTAWFDYNSTRNTLLIHVFDLVDEKAWLKLIKTRYEGILREIFE